MARETRNSIESQYKPNVIAYLERSRDYQSAVYLVVENIGTAPAIEIKFNMLSELKDGKYEKSCIVECFKKGPLFNGMSFIAPGKRWDTFIEMGFNMQDDLTIGSFEVDIAFKHTNGKNSYKTYNVFNMEDFTESIWLGDRQSKQVASLEKLSKSVEELKGTLKTKLSSVNANDTLRWSTLALMLSDSDDKALFRAILNAAFEPSDEQRKEIERWAQRRIPRYFAQKASPPHSSGRYESERLNTTRGDYRWKWRGGLHLRMMITGKGRNIVFFFAEIGRTGDQSASR